MRYLLLLPLLFLFSCCKEETLTLPYHLRIVQTQHGYIHVSYAGDYPAKLYYGCSPDISEDSNEGMKDMSETYGVFYFTRLCYPEYFLLITQDGEQLLRI